MTKGQKLTLMLAGIVLALIILIAPVTADHMTEYLNTNLQGGDYKTVAAPAKEDCKNTCLTDTQCKAATWVHRVNSAPSCWLKNSVPAKTPFPGDMTIVMHSYIREPDLAVITPATLSCDPVKASFMADRNSGTAPLGVHFTDTTIGALETIWIWGDGGKTQVVPHTEVDHIFTKPGTYIVNLTVADACGISSTTKTIEVSGPGSVSGKIRVDTAPGGAMVYIDGNPVGITPVDLMFNLTAGVHHIRITMTGYNDYVADITVTAGQAIELNIVMKKSTSATASPEIPGTMTTAVSTQTVTSTAPIKTLTDLDTVKTPSQPATGSGVLMVSSNPSGANVYLDGTSEGNTPLTVSNVTAGQHNLLLTLQGYTDTSRPVNVSAGSENQIAVDMVAAKKTPGFAAVAGVLSVALLVLFRKKIF